MFRAVVSRCVFCLVALCPSHALPFDTDSPPKYQDFAISASDIGNGNFSRVMRAVHRNSRQAFALKVVDKAKAEKLRKRHPNIRNEILMEKAVLNRIQHPNVIRLYNTWSVRSELCQLRQPLFIRCALQDQSSLYFLLEFAPGQELWHQLTQTHRGTPVCVGLSTPMTAYFLFQVALGLRACHAAGVLHRDLKPENVVLCPPRASPVQATDDFASIPAAFAASSRVVAKLIDFGTAKDLTGAAANGPEFVGTPEYIPPEVVSGGVATHAVDLWALGVLLFQCLTGFHPFGSGSPYMTMQRVQCARVSLPLYCPPSAQDLLHKLLLPDPVQRLQVWGAQDAPEHAVHAMLQHAFWDKNPRRTHLATALNTLASKLFPTQNNCSALPLALTPAASTGAAAGQGGVQAPPAPPKADRAEQGGPPAPQHPKKAPATWPAPPLVDEGWDTVQRAVSDLLQDEVLTSLTEALHGNTPLMPPPAPPQDKAPPPDSDTTLEGSSESLAAAVQGAGLERWLHWWAAREAMQQRGAEVRQWIRHQLALRSELWCLPLIALFAPPCVCPPGSLDILQRAQRCLAWARVVRSGLHPKRFRLNTPPSGAASQHEAFTGPFSLGVACCSQAGIAAAWEAVRTAAAAAGPDARLRAVLFVIQSDTEDLAPPQLEGGVLDVLASVPLNVQVAVCSSREHLQLLDGDEDRTWNTEWVLHGTRVCFWSPNTAQQTLEYAWWSDALDSSKYTSRHHLVVDVAGGLTNSEPLRRRVFQSAKRLVHHTSNTRAVLSCGQGSPPTAGVEGGAQPSTTLHALLTRAAPTCTTSEAPFELQTPMGGSSGGTAPRVLSRAGALTWAALDADEAEHGALAEKWDQLLPEARIGVVNAAADAGSDSEDEHAVCKRVPVYAAQPGAVVLVHFSQDGVSVVPQAH